MIQTDQCPGFLPTKKYVAGLLLPWKLISFGIGMLWLVYGALQYAICDWDFGISIIMGGCTYLLAPWSVRMIFCAVRLRPPYWPLSLVAAFVPAMFTVDWVYWLYHTAVGNRMLRWENFKTSMALYFICGILWSYQGTLKEFVADLKRSRKERCG